MKKYFYSDGKQKHGPLSFEELINEDISKQTLIWFDGLDDWTLAGELDEMKAILEVQPPPILKAEKNKSKTILMKYQDWFNSVPSETEKNVAVYLAYMINALAVICILGVLGNVSNIVSFMDVATLILTGTVVLFVSMGAYEMSKGLRKGFKKYFAASGLIFFLLIFGLCLQIIERGYEAKIIEVTIPLLLYLIITVFLYRNHLHLPIEIQEDKDSEE